MSGCGTIVRGWVTDIPVDPDAPHARDLLVRELGNPAYQAAKPTWLDLASKAVQDWFGSLLAHPGGVGNVLALVGIAAVVCLVAGAIIFFGLPRLSRRRRGGTELFDPADRRTAAQFRRSSEAAARAGDWDTAIADRYRAAVTGLDERTVITLGPGTTARDAARGAALAFPALGAALAAGAAAFDDVRYLDRSGSREHYAAVAELDERLQAAHPVSRFGEAAPMVSAGGR